MRVLLSERVAITTCACLVTAVSFAAFDSERAIISCVLGLAMLAIAASDAKRFIIPDVLSLPAIPLGLLATGLSNETVGAGQTVLEHTIAAVAAFGLLWLVRHAYHFSRQAHGLGLGDVKLGAVAGAWLGVQGATNALLLGCLLALTYAFGLSVLTRRPLSRTSVLPLGVFLAPAIWITWCVTGPAVPSTAADEGSSLYLIVPSPIG